jgi:hypothetical protein
MPDLFHSLIAIQVDKINRKLHPNGMDGFAGDDPQTFAGSESRSTQQTFSARSSIVGHVDAVCEFCSTSHIRYPQAHILSG